jgi:O-methyltransferase
MQIDPDKLPRAVALEYDLGEIVYSVGALPQLLPYSFNGAGLRLFGKLPGFLNDPAFERANARAVTNAGPKARNSGDLRWHVHVALWAASHAARLEGDFVECGVDTGMLSTAICEWLDFGRQDRDFWLFDTFAGIPDEQMTDAERAGIGGWHNRESYQECFAEAQASFAEWPRCHLIRGAVPDSLSAFPNGGRVAYLSIDMNIVLPEIAAIRFFWDRLVPGAVVLLDDYGWATHASQQAAFDAFAAEHGVAILNLPTGQGIIIR